MIKNGDCNKLYPPRSLTASLPLKMDHPNRKGKDRLPTTIFQGRAVKLPGCMYTAYVRENPPPKIAENKIQLASGKKKYFETPLSPQNASCHRGDHDWGGTTQSICQFFLTALF